MRYLLTVVGKFGFFVWIWEEWHSRFIKESSVNRTGRLALCLQIQTLLKSVLCLPFFILHLIPLGMDAFDFAVG